VGNEYIRQGEVKALKTTHALDGSVCKCPDEHIGVRMTRERDERGTKSEI